MSDPSTINNGPSVAETQAELKSVSRKLSACEAALEGQGSYLGIRDPATLLGQLKTLQKKDEQLREVLLILLRAQAPPPAPAAAPPLAAPLPPAPSTHPPPRSSPADVAYGQQRQQPPSNGSNGTPRANAGAAAAATAGAAARLAPLPLRFPDSSSGRSPIPARTGIGSAKSVSLHDALGIPPPESAAARAGAGPRGGRGGSAGGSSSSSSSLSAPLALTYRPGQHALYRLTNNTSGGGGGNGGGRGAVGRKASSGAGAPAPAPGSGDGGGPSGAAARADDRSGERACRGERAASRTAERGRFSSSSSPSSSSSSSFLSPSHSAVTTRAQPSSTAGPSAAATPSAGASSASGGGASASKALPSSLHTELGESGSGGDGMPSTPKRPTGESREAAAAKVDMKIKEEPIENMQDDIESEVSSAVADKPNRLFVTGVGTAAAVAAARAGIALAARPRDPTKSPLDVGFEVQGEMSAAAEAAVTSVVSEKPNSVLATTLKKRVHASAVNGGTDNFEIQNGGGVKRKAVDRGRRLPLPPPPRAGSDAIMVVETISIGGGGGADDDEDDRIPGPSKPSPPRNAVGLLGAAAEPPRGTAEAEPAERQPAEAPSADGQQGGPGDDGGEQPGEQPHQPGPASLPDEALIRDIAAALEGPEPRAPSAESAVPPARRARKRRKSAEAGGWRSRYNKNEFESGDALLASSSDGEGEEDWRGAGKRGASRHGGGDDADAEGAESDELVDVGVEEDDDDLSVYGGGDGGGGGGRAGNRKDVVEPVKKRSPPNAWKRRCADGDCQLGASFGMPGKPAKYCSAHKDAGMVNVTHRRCEEPRCERQPSFNFAGMKRTMFCGSHKKNGMVNVSSPRCDAGGCTVRPSFGFEGDRRAYLCDTHKEPGMVNIRKKSRRSSSSSNSLRSVVEEENPVTAAAEAWRCAQLAAAASAAGGSLSSFSFESSFLSDSPSTAAAAPAAASARPPAAALGSALSRFDDDVAIGGSISHGTEVGGGRGVARGGGDQPLPGSFLEAVDIAARGSNSEGISFAA